VKDQTGCDSCRRQEGDACCGPAMRCPVASAGAASGPDADSDRLPGADRAVAPTRPGRLRRGRRTQVLGAVTDDRLSGRARQHHCLPSQCGSTLRALEGAGGPAGDDPLASKRPVQGSRDLPRLGGPRRDVHTPQDPQHQPDPDRRGLRRRRPGRWRGSLGSRGQRAVQEADAAVPSGPRQRTGLEGIPGATPGTHRMGLPPRGTPGPADEHHGPRFWLADDVRQDKVEELGWTVVPVDRFDLRPSSTRLKETLDQITRTRFGVTVTPKRVGDGASELRRAS
jgi:hypothetical protein